MFVTSARVGSSSSARSNGYTRWWKELRGMDCGLDSELPASSCRRQDLRPGNSGYQSFPAAPAPPAPCTAVAAATIPTVTPITTGYPRQPLATAALPQHPPNGTFHPTALPSVGRLHGGGHNTLPHLRPGYPQQRNNSRAPSPGFHGHKFRAGFGRSLLGFHPKGLKRKADDTLSTDSGDSGNGRSDGSTASGEVFVYPLYCRVCRVTLNAPAQAKQHYEGKSHAKKVKLTDSSNSNATGGSIGGSSAGGGSSGHVTNSQNSLDQRMKTSRVFDPTLGRPSCLMAIWSSSTWTEFGLDEPRAILTTFRATITTLFCTTGQRQRLTSDVPLQFVQKRHRGNICPKTCVVIGLPTSWTIATPWMIC
ncbi:hypothetical protein LSH36_105g02001 [Paralvinella palmiformis]|uniref:U1-type domain-containing protein n=1 Tax=Paralvinella palmiformis TaxID=53620 RepID=A0AAD9JYY7_9ANNE|nr:hypothetical protein LSH36_105g02001 [Paralvinella palmiformis]